MAKESKTRRLKIKWPPFVKRHWQVVIVIAAFVLIGGIYALITSLAATASMSLAPASQSISLGSTVVVTITENSLTTTVNAVEADLTFPANKLQYVNTDASTSDFDSPILVTTGNGTVNISRGATTPISGNKTVAKVTFTAIGTGTANVNFAASSMLADSTQHTDILGTTNGATYTIADTTKPSTPTGLSKTGSTVNSITMSWTASTDNVGVTGYNIWRNGTKIDTSPTNSYTDNSGLSPNTTYNYYVEAYDAAGNTSVASASKAFSTAPDTQAPTVPGTPTLTSNTMTSITFHWTASTDNVGVTTYKVYRNGSQIGTSPTASYTDNGLNPGTNYTYTVSAGDAANQFSAQSAGGLLSTDPDTQSPTTPTGLSVAGATDSTVRLTWSASTDNVGVTGYNIYRNGSSTPVGTSNTTSFTDTGLTVNTTYTYTVQAYDASGNKSAKTGTVSATTSYKKGDVNGDGQVDTIDYSIIVNHWQKAGMTRAQGDLNADGNVDVLDYSEWLSNRTDL